MVSPPLYGAAKGWRNLRDLSAARPLPPGRGGSILSLPMRYVQDSVQT